MNIQAERVRAQQEELEEIENALTERILKCKNWLPSIYQHELESQSPRRISKRRKILQQLEAARLVDRYKHLSSKKFTFPTSNGSTEEVLAQFEDQLKKVREIPDQRAPNFKTIYSMHLSQRGPGRFLCDYTQNLNLDGIFTRPEEYGSYLDLEEFWIRSQSLQKRESTYLEFLESIPQLDSQIRLTQESYYFFQDLLDYLRGFYQKSNPLQRISDPDTDQTINKEWFCPSCLIEFATKGTYEHHFEGKRHKVAASRETRSFSKLLGAFHYYVDILTPVIDATRRNHQRRTLLTAKERQLENESFLKSADQEDDAITEDERPETNTTSVYPQSAHLVLDGRPMPQWLWKLNGLNQKFNCQICGDYIYQGRRAFDRHFSDSRHSHGLKCLGIVPGPTYQGITQIDQAIELSKTAKKSKFDAEVEDDEGNVMTEKVYNDLKKQGLV